MFHFNTSDLLIQSLEKFWSRGLCKASHYSISLIMDCQTGVNSFYFIYRTTLTDLRCYLIFFSYKFQVADGRIYHLKYTSGRIANKVRGKTSNVSQIGLP